jgi:hypothetical protein
MKAKDYIIIGGSAVALLLLWKNRKDKTITPTIRATPNSSSITQTTGGATAGTSQVASFLTPTTNEPEQVFGLGLPTGMDLPILTAGTGIPTEVAIQQGGVITMPKPAIVQPVNMTIEESLTSGNINPIEKPTVNPFPIKELLNVEPILTSPAIVTYPLKDLDYIAIKPFVYNEQPILQNQPFNSNQYDGAPIYIPQDRFISTLI